jgi:hypothetical protein
MVTENLMVAILDNRDEIENIADYGDVLFKVRDGKVDLHITKMVRCVAATCDEVEKK